MNTDQAREEARLAREEAYVRAHRICDEALAQARKARDEITGYEEAMAQARQARGEALGHAARAYAEAGLRALAQGAIKKRRPR